MMERKQKTVTVEIPEGKKAVWNEQGVLQLVDDDKESNEPKPVTERIKTFDDALSELEQRVGLGDFEARRLVDEWYSQDPEKTHTGLFAYLELCIIAAALNEGWKPQYTENERRWYPVFYFYRKAEIDEMSNKEKDTIGLYLLFTGDVGISSQAICDYSYPSPVGGEVVASYGFRLVYKTKALAEYAGRQFSSVYARFYFGEKAIGAMPWREFENNRKSSDNK